MKRQVHYACDYLKPPSVYLLATGERKRFRTSPLLCLFSREQLWLESGWGGEVLYLILLSVVFGSLDFFTASNLKRVWEELLSAGRGCVMSWFS